MLFLTLHQVPAQDIASIRVLTGSEGATYYGLRGAAGVILIRTRQASDS